MRTLEKQHPKFTGIRAIPFATPRVIMQPHLARYTFAIENCGQAVTALDVACGTGYGTFAVKCAGLKNVWGIDLDRSAVSYATDQFRETDGIGFLQGDGSHIPLATGSVDFVSCFETYEHMLDPHRFLDEICRVLKPTGTLVISVPNAPMWSPFSPKPNLDSKQVRLGLGHKYDYAAQQFLDLLAGYFETILPFGQDFRRASFEYRVLRFLERVRHFVKYKIAQSGIFPESAKPFFNDVLPQDDLLFEDMKWKVKPWTDKRYEPVYCVAVCRVKRVHGQASSQ